MAEGEQDLTNLAARVAAELLARRDWQLITPTEWPGFVAEVAQRALNAAAGTPEPAHVERATVTAYCGRWYAACLDRDPERQQRAWLELHRRVRGMVLRFVERAEMEEAAQGVLTHLFERLNTVREPGAFLRWVDQVTRNWCIDRYYRAGMAEAPLDDEATAGVPLPPHSTDAEHIETLIQRCLRSQAQQRVVAGRLLYDRSVEDLAAELGTTPSNIRVLAHRAMARLKNCTELQDYLRAKQAQHTEADDPRRMLRERPMIVLTCAECQSLLTGFVEQRYTGRAVDSRYAGIPVHLATWHDCTLEYLDLLELARAVEPTVDIPPPDLAFLSRR